MYAVQGWGVLYAYKVVLGFWLKGAAHAYVQHFERRHRRAAARPPPSRAANTSNVGKGTKRE